MRWKLSCETCDGTLEISGLKSDLPEHCYVCWGPLDIMPMSDPKSDPVVPDPLPVPPDPGPNFDERITIKAPLRRVLDQMAAERGR